jgi:IclR family pca regulon transcriptional regulator
MAALSATGLREHAHPHLRELRDRTGYSASISVLDGSDTVFVDRVPSFRRAGAESELDPHPGSRLPAYCTAMGKLLLAHLPDEELGRRLAAMKPAKRTPRTITSKRALREQLRELRGASLGVDDGELTARVHAIAAPVRDGEREVVAAVSLAAPVEAIPLEEMVGALGPHVIAAADGISARLGYRRDDERA